MTKVGKYFPYETLRDVPLHGQTVLVRADYNVPLDDKGKIASDFRIQASLPTLNYLLDRQCKVVICSHLGRPDGKRDMRYSLHPVATRLAQLIRRPIVLATDCIGDGAKQAVKRAQPGQIILLENLRFHPGEEDDDPNFAKRLAQDSGARYFVQDGFGVVHRAHASTSAITRLLPSVGGLLLEREVSMILSAMHEAEKPFVAVMGGAKISDKMALIERFIKVADKILIGGAMANTFLQYYGLPIGKSKFEAGLESEIQKIADLVYKKERKLIWDSSEMMTCQHIEPKPCLLCSQLMILPIDVAVGQSIDRHARRTSVGLNMVSEKDYILDIGDKTIRHFDSQLAGVRTIIWNGTMGMAELPAFTAGSAEIAHALHHRNQTSIIGGGDTADYVLDWNHGKTTGFSHISTGGGASLELMAGEKLPGVVALLKRRAKK